VSAATKTFNIAGLGGAWVIIENPNLKAQFERFGSGLNQGNNPLTVVATRAALAHCEDWRLSLIEHLQSNRALLSSTIEQLEGISMNEIQGPI
jgi:cystathionine beta-lyase